MRYLILSCFACIGAAPAPLHAQEAAASAACTGFNQVETEGRAQIERRIAEIDAAAAAGDVVRFCGASGDLIFVYRSLQAAGASCSPERAVKWEQAAAESQAALAKACR